ncbi:hypothetical protein GBA52_008669 [Prunus armeniaca]|nr:hypothetical protein GBA52_008669 [Prunus armeniaca]
MLEQAAQVISRFLKSDSHNLKYMGIDALVRLIKISPEIAEQHQLAVIDCLETMNKVFEHAGDLVNVKVAHNLVKLIAEGFGEDDDSADSQLRSSAIDKSLSFLNGYVQQALEKGAQPYIPENERSGMLNISNFSNEALTHGLRFEAYELPKPAVPSRIPPAAVASSTELVPVPEPSYAREIRQPASLPPVSDAGSSELKLRLDGVQRKWGRPTYSSPALSISNSSSSSSQKSANGVTQIDSVSTSNSKARDTYESRRPQVEISPEKQKLASSLFGGSSKNERRPSSANHKVSKANIHASEKPQVPKAAAVHTEVNHEPAPDLLDLGDSTSSTASTVDPFKQLEGLLDQTEVALTANHGAAGAAKTPDIMGLYADTSLSGLSSSVGDPLPTNRDEFNLASEWV